MSLRERAELGFVQSKTTNDFVSSGEAATHTTLDGRRQDVFDEALRVDSSLGSESHFMSMFTSKQLLRSAGYRKTTRVDEGDVENSRPKHANEISARSAQFPCLRPRITRKP